MPEGKRFFKVFVAYLSGSREPERRKATDYFGLSSEPKVMFGTPVRDVILTVREIDGWAKIMAHKAWNNALASLAGFSIGIERTGSKLSDFGGFWHFTGHFRKISNIVHFPYERMLLTGFLADLGRM
jgi:hypothetical protein